MTPLKPTLPRISEKPNRSVSPVQNGSLIIHREVALLHTCRGTDAYERGSFGRFEICCIILFMEQYVHKKVEKKRLREKLYTDRQKRADFSRGRHRGYDHRRVERHWQRVWAKTGLYRTGQLSKANGQKFYILDMLDRKSTRLNSSHSSISYA